MCRMTSSTKYSYVTMILNQILRDPTSTIGSSDDGVAGVAACVALAGCGAGGGVSFSILRIALRCLLVRCWFWLAKNEEQTC
jgi:hypothetical protein